MRGGQVTFVFPRLRYVTGDPPLGVAYLAAVLRRERPGIDVRLVDGTFLPDSAALFDAALSSKPALLGVYVDSLMAPLARKLARAARERGVFALAGGPLATIDPRALLPDFDAVALGEGEGLVADVADRVLDGRPLSDVPNLVLRGEGGQPLETPRADRAPDLAALPHPAWELLDLPRYARLWPYLDSTSVQVTGTNVVGSRGCPWRCTYCQPTLCSLFGPKVRRRSPEAIVAEIAELQARYDVGGIFFHDDTLTADRGWLLRLCDELRAMKRPVLWGCNSRVDVFDEALVEPMAAAGMRSVHLGIEAGSERVRNEVLGKPVDIAKLERLLARLERHRVHALGFFMLGSPTETLPEMLSTVALASRLALVEATFSLTSVFPGTRLHERVAGDPRLALRREASVDYYNHRNFDDPAGLGDLGLRALQLAGLGAFYLHPRRAGYLLRHLGSRRGLAKLGIKAARFLAPLAKGRNGH